MSGKPWICPDTALQNYPETRLGYVVTTLQSLMTNHFPLSVSLHAGSNGDFGKVWKKLSKTDVASIQEMEAVTVTKLQSAYAVDEFQQSNSFNRNTGMGAYMRPFFDELH